MALTSQGTKKKVCYYYDGKKYDKASSDYIRAAMGNTKLDILSEIS